MAVRDETFTLHKDTETHFGVGPGGRPLVVVVFTKLQHTSVVFAIISFLSVYMPTWVVLRNSFYVKRTMDFFCFYRCRWLVPHGDRGSDRQLTQTAD